MKIQNSYCLKEPHQICSSSTIDLHDMYTSEITYSISQDVPVPRYIYTQTRTDARDLGTIIALVHLTVSQHSCASQTDYKLLATS